MLKSAKIRTKFKKNSNLKPVFPPFWPIFQHFAQSSLCLQINATASLPNRNKYLTAHNPEQKQNHLQNRVLRPGARSPGG